MDPESKSDAVVASCELIGVCRICGKHFHKHLTTAQAKYVPDKNLVSMKGGKGISEQTSRKLTRYYNGAIMNNTGDVSSK